MTQGTVGGDEQRSVVRWWFRDQDAWRWEFDQLTPLAYTQTAWLEGGVFYRYDGRTNSYSITPVASFQADASPRWWAPWVPHWFGTASPWTSVQGLRAWYMAFDGIDGVRVATKLAGQETALGRRTEILEVTWRTEIEGPAFDVDGRPMQDATGALKTTPAEVVTTNRMCVDPERMMILCHESSEVNPARPPGEPPFVMSATVTRLDYDIALPDAELRSEIPAGAKPGLQP